MLCLCTKNPLKTFLGFNRDEKMNIMAWPKKGVLIKKSVVLFRRTTWPGMAGIPCSQCEAAHQARDAHSWTQPQVDRTAGWSVNQLLPLDNHGIILLINMYKNSRRCGYPPWNVISTMAKNAQVSKQEEEEKEDGAWCELMIPHHWLDHRWYISV